jgi:hypothetical protein
MKVSWDDYSQYMGKQQMIPYMLPISWISFADSADTQMKRWLFIPWDGGFSRLNVAFRKALA